MTTLRNTRGLLSDDYEVEFSIFGNDEVVRYSAINEPNGLHVPEAYDNFEPKRGGVMDMRMGVADDKLKCATCGLNPNNCPGHFGHIKLPQPVFQMAYFKYLHSILSMVCINCSELYIDKTEEELNEELKNVSGKNRFDLVKKMSANLKACPRCGTPRPKIKKEISKKNYTINIVAETVIGNVIDEATNVESKQKMKLVLDAKYCRAILQNMSDASCRMLGLRPEKSRPEDFIVVNLPISPIATRPPSKTDQFSHSQHEDSNTSVTADIIKATNRLHALMEKQELTGEISKYTQDSITLVQYHVAVLYDNETLPLPRSEQKSGNVQTKGLKDRVNGKNGRVRGNCMAKRNDFSARTVITSDPNVKTNHLGVPSRIAMVTTFPEKVTPENMEEMQTLVDRGPYEYPGANYVFQNSRIDRDVQNRFKIDLRFNKQKITLRVGDIIERHLINGDLVLFNRQPSLHKYSMMTHKVHIINNPNLSTFRMNVSATSPYNADFDGDEMNIFVPQSIQTRHELLLAEVKQQLISAAKSQPSLGPVQDTVVGSYLMTMDGVVVSHRDWPDLISHTSSQKHLNIPKNKDLTGKELYSLIIPPGINGYWKKSGLKIVDGTITEGVVDKKTVGAQKNGIIHKIWFKHGPDACIKFIDDAQRLVNNWLMLRGFSIGFADACPTKEIREKSKVILSAKKLEINHLITEIENNPDLIPYDVFENSLFQDLSVVSGELAKMSLDTIGSDNAFKQCIDSGSKGNEMNFGQIMGALGQNQVENKRIKKRINNRTLPHFHQHDDSADARGFIDRSFETGLLPHHFWYHTSAGREGLIDTAIKTADSGYLTKRLIKGCEDIMIHYDGTVRNGTGVIIQYVYGDNNVNQTRQTEQRIHYITYDNQKLKDEFEFSKSEISKLSVDFKHSIAELNKLNKSWMNDIFERRDSLRKIQSLINYNYTTMNDGFMFSTDILRVHHDYILNQESDDNDLDPFYVIEQLQVLLEPVSSNIVLMKKSDMNNKSALKYQNDQMYKYMLKCLLLHYLSPKVVILKYRLSKRTFDTVIGVILKELNESMVEPGEMVGVLAAQSIGEPSTQFTLNTFHSTGMAAMGTGMIGIRRIKELLNCTKNIQTPKMTIYIDPTIPNNKLVSQKIASLIEYADLYEITDYTQIVYDIDGKSLVGDNMGKPYSIMGDSTNVRNSPWVLKIVLDREKMVLKDIEMRDIKTKIIEFWDVVHGLTKEVKRNYKQVIDKVTNLVVATNSDMDPVQILHIRFSMSQYERQTLIEFQDFILKGIPQKGIDNIATANDIMEQSYVSFDGSNGKVETLKENVIYTNGVNIEKIRYIKGVDLRKTTTNDIVIIYHTFGIEAARNALIREFQIPFKSQGTSLNYHHLAILVDQMTHTGTLTSIDRHGLNKLDIDPLSRASFERTMDQFIQAAVFGEIDTMKSVSSRIMTGRPIKGGTGLCEVVMDIEKLENSDTLDQSAITAQHSTTKKMGLELTSTRIFDEIMSSEKLGFSPE